jgi:lysocardiolipin and lysophospholipid acyltransferase
MKDLRGIFFLLCILLSTLFGSIFVVAPPFLLFFVFQYPLYKKCEDWIASAWFIFPAVIYEKIFGVKIYFAGDDLRNPNHYYKGEPAIIISNHRTRFDWMFVWSWFLRQGSLQHLKIILKESLKKLPTVGWAMQQFCFIFLARDWEKDEKYMEKALNHFVDHDYPVQLFLFPEGTDLCDYNKIKVITQNNYYNKLITFNRVKILLQKMGLPNMNMFFIQESKDGNMLLEFLEIL